jgi:predicted dehydrogenase
VEDQVTAYLEYADGSSAVFIASTGEAPGTNRLEVAAERGRVVVEQGEIRYLRNEVETSAFSETTEQAFGVPPVWDVRIPVSGSGSQHQGILQSFTDAILGRAELLAPAIEGIHSVELANAMLYSAFEDRVVELPLDAAAYERHLNGLIANSRYMKPETIQAEADVAKSF